MILWVWGSYLVRWLCSCGLWFFECWDCLILYWMRSRFGCMFDGGFGFMGWLVAELV